MKEMKPTLTQPSTPSTRAMKASGRWRENTVTATVHNDSDIAHSSKEPSWLPHTPVILYISGVALCEFDAASCTEKSLVTKAQVRHT